MRFFITTRSRRLVGLTMAVGMLAAMHGHATAKGPIVDLAEGAHGILVAKPGTGVLQVDAQRGRVVSTVDVGREPVQLAVGRGFAWTVGGRRVLSVIDQDRDRVIRRARLSVRPDDIAVGNRSVWVAGQERRGGRWKAVLVRLDPQTLREVGRFSLGQRPTPSLTFHDRAIWLSFPPRRRAKRAVLLAIDEGSGKVRVRRRLRGAILGTAGADGSMWLSLSRSNRRRPQLLQLDSRQGTRQRIFSGPEAPALSGIATDGKVIWAASQCGGRACDVSKSTITAYDAATGAIVGGPYRMTSPSSNEPQFIGGISGAGPRSVAVGVTDGSGDFRLSLFTPRRGLLRQIPF